MKQFFIFKVFFLLAIYSNFCSTLSAQATRTWVSGVGDDVNPCSRTAPCKTFAGAISKTATGGEINVIDPGGYGTVTIIKSMTIDGGGTHASILASMVNGIIINAPDAVIVIRRLSINGAGNGLSGIKITAAKKVIIENCYVANFIQKGIEINTTMPCTVIINDVTVHNVEDAVAITNAGGSVIIDDCNLQAINKTGINLIAGQATVSNSRISDCNTGVNAEANSTIRLSNNVISDNNTGIKATGTVASSANNIIAGNKTAGSANAVIRQQ